MLKANERLRDVGVNIRFLEDEVQDLRKQMHKEQEHSAASIERTNKRADLLFEALEAGHKPPPIKDSQKIREELRAELEVDKKRLEETLKQEREEHVKVIAMLSDKFDDTQNGSLQNTLEEQLKRERDHFEKMMASMTAAQLV